MNSFYLGVVLVIISATGFGLIPVFAIYAYQGGVTVTTLLFLRFFIAALFFFAFIYLQGIKPVVDKATLGALFILGAVLYMLQSNFYFSSVKYIPASLAVLLFYTYPIFVALLSSIFNREVLSRQVLVSIAVSIAGLVMVLGNSFGGLNTRGLLLAVGSAMVYSCYIVISGRVLQRQPVMVASAWVTLFAACSFLVMGLLNGGLDFNLAPQAWYAVAGVALFSTIVAVFTFFRGIELIGSTRASILSMVEPLVTIGFSAALFAERLSWLQFVGGLAVLGGALLVATAPKPATRHETA